MARDRYPSDEPSRRSKQRPHVKIHLSTRNHRKTAGHFGSAEFRGQLLGLFFVAAERFAGKTEGKLHLSRTDIEWISGKRRRDVALTSVQRLADIMEYSHELRGDVLVIEIPKFAKKQGYAPQLRSGTPTPSADSASLQGTKEPKNRGAEGDSAELPIADAPDPPTADQPVNPYRLPPGTRTLSPKLIRDLIETKPNGVVHTAEDVACWFAHKHPQMVARRRTDFAKAARDWFPNAKPGEVNESREWVRLTNANASATRIRAERAARPPPKQFTEEEIENARRLLSPKR